MSESVKILIEAENRASAVIDTTAKDIENKVKGIKTSGEQAKKSTEFFGAIANALGGSEIGAFASQLGQITEKTSQFAEVQKLGGAGALAFKAGLVAAVGVIAFQVGSAIGNAIFQTEKWSEKLKEASEKARELASSAASIRQTKFTERKEDIEIFQDPEKKRAEYEKLLDELKTNLAGVENQARTSKKTAEEWQAAWQITGDRRGFAEQAKQQAQEDADRVKSLQTQKGEIEKILSSRTKENDELSRSEPLLKTLREEYAMIEATQSDVAKKGIFVGDNAGADALREEIKLLEDRKNIAGIEEKAKQSRLGSATAETTELMIQVEIAKKKADLAKEETAEKTKSRGFIDSLQKELAGADAARLDASRARTNFTGPDATLNALKEEIKLLEDKKNIYGLTEKARMGTVDADQKEAEALLLKIALSQKQMELGKAEQDQAKRIAEIKASEMQKIEEQTILLTKGKAAAYAFSLEKQGLSKEDAASIASKQQKQIDRPILQGLESRLLTRGSGEDPTKQVAANTASAVEELRALNKQLLKNNPLSLKIVSGGGM